MKSIIAELHFPEDVRGLAGEKEGHIAFREQIEKSLPKTGLETLFVLFPKQIERISYSWVSGFLGVLTLLRYPNVKVFGTRHQSKICVDFRDFMTFPGYNWPYPEIRIVKTKEKEKTMRKAPIELKDTVDMMLSNDRKIRFLGEYWQAQIRYEKLHAFVIKVKAGLFREDLLSCPLENLVAEKAALGNYLQQLEIRAAIENIDLYDLDTKENHG